jgi:hypothetical protein
MNSTITVRDFPNTEMNIRMKVGHQIRMNHAAVFIHVSEDKTLLHTVRLCCGDIIPDSVKTFSQATSTAQ